MAWYRQAADQGSGAAQNNLGAMYQHGLGVPQDYAQAMAWYSQGAERGSPEAQNNLGYMYSNGLGVSQDFAQAVAWYRKSAQQGFATAQDNLREAEARLASANAFKPFLDQAGAEKWVMINELVTNPFVYENEKIAVAVAFQTMISRDNALFGRQELLVVSGVPAQRFTREGEWVLLVGQVDSKEYVKVPMHGELLLTHLEYVDARTCEHDGCE